MEDYSFLSGSVIDNTVNYMFDAFESEQCYLGFAKGDPQSQWGVSALIQIQHTAPASAYPSLVVASTSGDIGSAKFHDNNTRKLFPDSTLENQRITIVRVSKTGGDYNTLPLGDLFLTYIGKQWVVIQGLVPNFYDIINIWNDIPGAYDFYIHNFSNKTDIRLKINIKQYTYIPYYITNCKLMMGSTQICSGLQKITDIQGETYVKGIVAPELISDSANIFDNTSTNKTIALSASFQLVNLNNQIVIDNMTFDSPDGSSNNMYTEITTNGITEKYLSFSYPYTNDVIQHIKFKISDTVDGSYAIFPEALSFDTTLPAVPISDGNPPAPEISYLKNSSFSSSIFDVNGLYKIKNENIKYVKELMSTGASANYSIADGFEFDTIEVSGSNITHSGTVMYDTPSTSATNIIYLNDFHDFIVGDQLYIPVDPINNPDIPSPDTYTIISVNYNTGQSSITLNTNVMLSSDLLSGFTLTSEYTNIDSRITLVQTTNKELALNNGFYNMLITLSVPLRTAGYTISPTENIYRQLFISYKPKSVSGDICSEDVISGDLTQGNANFNINKWEYDNGRLLYLANKIPVFRKWANQDEVFKIIL